MGCGVGGDELSFTGSADEDQPGQETRVVQKPVLDEATASEPSEQQSAASQQASGTPQASGSRPNASRTHAQATGAHAEAQAPQAAIAIVRPVGESQVSGSIKFEPKGEGMRIYGEVKGLSAGKHGFHVHQFGDLSDTSKGESAGGHFNPHGSEHGERESEQRHVGDFGNIEATQAGVANIDFVDPLVTLSGPNSILGRAIVIHAGEDKFTQPSGDAGARVAFGVVGVAE
jgi:Cu-Zn family superoxide dismutase